MLCVLMEALGIDIGKMTEQAHARPQESGTPMPPGTSAAPECTRPENPDPPAAIAQPSTQSGVALN